jgi:surface protein
MFYLCSSIENINLSNFNTIKAEDMSYMFYYCIKLTSLNLSNFITNNVEYMDNMFNGCNNLNILNLSNFNTTKIKTMENMFKGCSSLTSLDISNFDTFSIEKQDNLNNIFSNCENLIYINLYNYKNGNYHFTKDTFKETIKNLVIYSVNTNLKNELKDNNCIKVNSEENWYEKRAKITKDDICTDDCKLTEYQFEYKYKCYSNCPIGTYNNNYKCEDCHPDCNECEEANTTFSSNCKTCKYENKFLYFGNCIEKCTRDSYYNESINQSICKCELPQCYTCTRESLDQKLCTKCEDGYYPIYDDLYINNYPNLNCSKSPDGYYHNFIILNSKDKCSKKSARVKFNLF